MKKLLSANNLILIIILAASFALMFYSSIKESAVMDELAHIPAGYGYVKYFDYRLNPEHPPLIKAIAAIPLLFQNLKFPTDKFSWTQDINGQWAAGAQFLYEEGNSADQIINWSRIGVMFLTLILIIFTYVWAKELIGKWWAFLPTLLVAFSPNFLAHGHYVTTDIGAALGFFISIYYFVKYLQNRTKNKKNLVVAGIAFGIAQLMKFSTVLLIPLFGFLIIIYAIYKAWKKSDFGFFAKIFQFFKELVKFIGSLIIVFAIGYLLVYVVYFIFTINYPMEKQKADTTTILASFADGPNTCKLDTSTYRNSEISNPIRCIAEINILMTENKITRPFAQYMLGVLMVMQRSSGGNTGYFMGEISAAGWWYYFPIVFLLKEPLPSLIIITFAIILAIIRFFSKFKTSGIKNRFFNYIELNFAEFSMLSFVVLYWAYSIKSPLNIGVRHILPTLPFIYILSSQAIKNWAKVRVQIYSGFWKNIFNAIITILKNSIKISLIILLMAWFILGTFIAFPYYISYFNELGGGTWNGYKYVTDSNYDWGQDLKRLSLFVNPLAGKSITGKKIDKIAVDYFGGGNIKYYLGDKGEIWQSSKGNPKLQEINWIAISINSLQSALGKLHPGQLRNPEDEYRWLTQIKNPYQPDYRIGTTMFVYKLQ